PAPKEPAKAEEPKPAEEPEPAEATAAEQPTEQLGKRLEELKTEKAANDAKIEEVYERIRRANERARDLGDEAASARGAARERLHTRARRAAAKRDALIDERGGLARRNAEIRGEAELLDLRLHPEARSELPCFSGDTLVWTVGGPKRIDQVSAGERVYGFDF